MNDIHKWGGIILGTSCGGHDTSNIVHSIEDRDQLGESNNFWA
jgi:6-phosphofructokinase 1